MSPAPNWEPAYPPSTQQPVHHEDSDEDTKAPYDDLIDQYATPFRQNPTHKAYTVDPSAFDHKNDSGKDVESASSQGHDWAYPPATSAEEKGKGKAWTWSSVRPVHPIHTRSVELRSVAHTRLYCLSAIPSDRPGRDSN